MRPLAWLVLLPLLVLPGAGRAADRYFTTSDGVRLHYIEAGDPAATTLLFVPGWTMPAWIFQLQIAFFAPSYHVVALDPRGQGSSDVPPGGYEPYRRGADIGDVLRHLQPQRVVLVGWSLGVLDCLAYLHEAGDGQVSGLVLIDNSVGENPPPSLPRPAVRAPPRPLAREVAMARFVRSMFHRPQPPEFLTELTQAALRTPPDASAQLLAYPVPRSFWREAIYSVNKPILYVVTPRLAEQAQNLQDHHPAVWTHIYEDAGHALFIDDANRFDAELLSFLQTAAVP